MRSSKEHSDSHVVQQYGYRGGLTYRVGVAGDAAERCTVAIELDNLAAVCGARLELLAQANPVWSGSLYRTEFSLGVHVIRWKCVFH